MSVDTLNNSMDVTDLDSSKIKPLIFSRIDSCQILTRLNVDAYVVTQVIKKYRKVYTPCSEWERGLAWRKITTALNYGLRTCQITFQRAFRNYRIYKLRDPTNQCQIAKKYFKHMDEIYRVIKQPIGGKLNIKTPSELNQSIELQSPCSDEVVDVDQYVPDINMSNCNIQMVMRNWALAFSSLPTENQVEFTYRLRLLFEKYESRVEK